MAIIEVNPEELGRRALPEGLYPVRIEKCERAPLKSDPSQWKVVWQFRVRDECPDPLARGHVMFSHTSLAAGKGDTYLRFVRGLGHNPSRFDTDDVVGTNCVIRITQRVRTDPSGASSPIVDNEVVELMRES